MAYPQEILVGALVPQSTAFGTAQPVGTAASAAVYGSYVALYPVMVQRYMFQVSTAIGDSTSGVVEMSKVTVANVTTSIASITIPNGTAARKVLVKDFSPVKIGCGDKLEFRMKTQAGQGGTPVGAGFHGFLASLQPEVSTNETNCITSA